MYPILCVQNYLDDLVYTGHTLLADEEAEGYEVFRIANGRRSAEDRWQAATANAQRYIEITFDQARTFDFIWIERNHNLAGESIELRTSDNGFGTFTSVFNITVPSTSSAGTSASAAAGCRTNEGCWLKLFTAQTALAARLYIPAMGAGLVPQIPGMILGEAWQPSENLVRPVGTDQKTLMLGSPAYTDSGWRGSGQAAQPHRGELNFRLRSQAAETDATAFFSDYERPRPAVIIPDADQAERAFVGLPPDGAVLGVRYEPGWAWPVATVPYEESSPARKAG